MSYWYDRETNQYAAEAQEGKNVSYVRGGSLARIEYGTWDRGSSDRSTTPLAKIVFDRADRCLSDCAQHDGSHWPDTPWDLECKASATSCDDFTPTFWSTKRLTKVVTWVWDTTAATPGGQDVDSYTLEHGFPSPGDGQKAGLWLKSIVHAGHVGGTVTMPPVTLEPVALPNRVLTKTNTTNNWQRLSNIYTETGARIQVTYSLPECTSANLPATPHTNTKLCYPVVGPDPYDPDGPDITEWWHKYVVRQVSQTDVQLADGHQAPTINTYYTYGGTPAWHYADDDGLTKPKRRTWDQFRGYRDVTVQVGDTDKTLTRTTYLRGMHGDRSGPGGGTRSVSVDASVGSETVNDEDQFAGMVREQVVYNGTDDKPVSKTVNVPWRSAPTASRTINGDTVTARFVGVKTTYSATALGVTGARGWRVTGASSTFDDYGTVTTNQDSGDVARTGDERCTSYTYTRNTAKNIVTLPRQVTVTALPCGTAPTSPDHVISDVRTFYDGATDAGTAPVHGAATRVDELKDWTAASGTSWLTSAGATFDAFGRPATVTDVKGNTTTTTYTPAAGLVTRLTTKNHLDWVTTTDLNPYWGTPVKVTDPNKRVAETVYDALGRTRQVWEIGWSRTKYPARPSRQYTYGYSANRSSYPYVQTETVNPGFGVNVSYQIFDGLLRPRQSQTMAVGGGRVVTDTLYDSWGRADLTFGAHAEPGDPSGTLWWEPEWSVPTQSRTVYDRAGRPTEVVFRSGDGVTNVVDKWRTTTSHEGDRTTVTPPRGGTITTTVVDPQGRTVELRQYTTDAGAAGDHDTTRYAYNAKGQLTTVTDPGGNQWSYTFDMRGRQVESRDPDRGTTVSVYNDAGELTRTTDARGEVLAYSYDSLGRKTGVYDDAVGDANKRAEWKYDSLFAPGTAKVRGQLTEAIRYDDGNAYKWQARTFSPRYQVMGQQWVIPTAETGLSGTYEYGPSYNDVGAVTDVVYPPGGGLTGEAVTTKYDKNSGLPRSLDTATLDGGTYVAAQQYSAYGEPTVTTLKTAGGSYTEEVVSYEPDTRRVHELKIKPETAAGTVADRTYNWEHNGNLLAITDAPQVGQADTQCFGYDRLQRLTSAWTPKAGVSCGTALTMAGMGGPAPYWLDWTIDKVGNRVKEVSHAADGDTTRTYAVPASGAGVVRPHAVTGTQTTTPGQSTPTGTAYGYDAAGNMTTRPGQTVTWDAEGRPVKVVEGDKTVTNLYDADGNRLIRRDSTGTTLFLPGNEIRRAVSGGTATFTGTRYYTFGGRTIGSRTPGLRPLTWLFGDHQGTQAVAVNAETAKVDIRRQLPYGGLRGPQSIWPTGKGFVGGDVDPTGLIHIGAREYDPALGRFISVDPVQDLADPQQWNGYSYANNDPITRSDPTGLIPDDCRQFDCYGYSLTTGCPGGCGSTGNVAWGQANNKPSSAPNKASRKYTGRTRDGRPYPVRSRGERWTRQYYSEFFYLQHISTAQLDHLVDTDMCSNVGEGCEGLANATPGINWESVKELFGITDVEDCIGGSASSCAWAAANFAPAGLGKLAKLKYADEAADAARACSFTGDTLVLMADGSTKPIAEMEVGDEVRATDPDTGETAGKTVQKVFRHEDSVIGLDVDGRVVMTTEDHPFWNATDKRFERADALDIGDRLLSDRGETGPVRGLRPSTRRTAQAYNLSIADIHTYYVFADNAPVLVHNDCGSVGRDLIDGEAQYHIIAGNRTGGGHKWPGQPGKTVFPQSWDTDKILDGIADVATNPSSNRTWQTGSHGSLYTRRGDPSRVKIEGVYDGVQIRVIFEPATDRVITGFPIG